MRTWTSALAAAAMVLVAGWFALPHDEDAPNPPQGASTPVPTLRLSESPDPQPPAPTRFTRDGGRITFDKPWRVYDGVWMMGELGLMPMPDRHRSSNGLLMDSSRRVLWLAQPGMYGAYPTQVALYESRPNVPSGCEDVVEVPLVASGRHPVVFDSDGPSRPLGLVGGTYRVRLCANGLDEALGERELDGDRLHVSASRFRFQVWPAPDQPGAIVRVGSDYARQVHSGATS